MAILWQEKLQHEISLGRRVGASEGDGDGGVQPKHGGVVGERVLSFAEGSYVGCKTWLGGCEGGSNNVALASKKVVLRAGFLEPK